jgi:hypothetical protein
LEILLGAATTTVGAWVLRLAVTAFREAVSVFLLGAFLVSVATPTPEASRLLLAVDADVAEALAVVALC